MCIYFVINDLLNSPYSLTAVNQSKLRDWKSKTDLIWDFGTAIQEIPIQIALKWCSEEGKKSRSVWGIEC
jgi:hypothetical protein